MKIEKYFFYILFWILTIIPCDGFEPWKTPLEENKENWQLITNETAATFVNLPGGNGLSVLLSAYGNMAGMQTLPLALDIALDRRKAYLVRGRLLCRGIHKGTFSFGVCYNNELGHSLEVHPVWSSGVRVKESEWFEVTLKIGSGTEMPFPKNAQHVALKFAFMGKKGEVLGSMGIDDVSIQPVENIRQSWPSSINVRCGEIDARFDSAFNWSLSSLFFKGALLGRDNTGSHYGTAVAFTGVQGFFGGSHIENQAEEIVDKKISLDGKFLDIPEGKLEGKSLILEKRAFLKNILQMHSKINITDRFIDQEIRMMALENARIDRFYLFMFPWIASMTEYAALTEDGTVENGNFKGLGSFLLEKRVKWTGVYNEENGLGAVVIVRETPKDRKWSAMYWDQPTSFKKLYFIALKNERMPVNTEFIYKLRIIPFMCSSNENWVNVAGTLASQDLTGNF